MTTNSKNSRMRYHGFNNNRMYQASLRIKRDNKKFERTLSKGVKHQERATRAWASISKWAKLRWKNFWVSNHKCHSLLRP